MAKLAHLRATVSGTETSIRLVGQLVPAANRVALPGIPIAQKLIERIPMETFVVAATLVGSFFAAFVIQKAALEGLFRIITGERRLRQ